MAIRSNVNLSSKLTLDPESMSSSTHCPLTVTALRACRMSPHTLPMTYTYSPSLLDETASLFTLGMYLL